MLGTWAHTCTFLDRQVHCFTQKLRTSKSLLLMEQHLPQRPNMSASNRYQYLFYCDVHVSVNVRLHSTVWFHVHSYMLIVLDDDVEREGLGRNCEKRDAGGTVRKQLLRGGWGDRRVTEELKEKKRQLLLKRYNIWVCLATCSRGLVQHCGMTLHGVLFVCVLTESQDG